jgi:hypothetical protein
MPPKQMGVKKGRIKRTSRLEGVFGFKIAVYGCLLLTTKLGYYSPE